MTRNKKKTEKTIKNGEKRPELSKLEKEKNEFNRIQQTKRNRNGNRTQQQIEIEIVN